MMKPKMLALLVAVLLPVAAKAQSPTDGHVVGHTYVNNSLHLSYTWPGNLNPVKLPPAAEDKNTYEYLLFSAKGAGDANGLVMVAHKLNMAGPHSEGLKSSGDMIARLANSLRPGPMLANIARTQKKSASGRVFDELTYTMNGKPAAVMATQIGEYLIVFKCSAGSAAEIAAMEKSALGMRVGK